MWIFMYDTLLLIFGPSSSWLGLPLLSWFSPNLSSLISHLIMTVSTSHGSSLTMRLLGDVGRFPTASDTPEECEVHVWSSPILLGDDGRADSWLWQETCEGGLAKRPTVEKEDGHVIHVTSILYILSIILERAYMCSDKWPHTHDWWINLKGNSYNLF